MLILAALSCRQDQEISHAENTVEGRNLLGHRGRSRRCVYNVVLCFRVGRKWFSAPGWNFLPFVVLWGVAAGMLTHYTWSTGARFVACFLGVVAGLLSLIELLVGAFTGPFGLSGLLLAPLGSGYPSTFELIGGVVVAGLLYQAALLAVLLVIRQLFRWANRLISVFHPNG